VSIALPASSKTRITASCERLWEIIADNLSNAGWSWGCVSAVDSGGRTIFVADAHRGDGKRLVVRADEKLTAFVELASAIQTAQKDATECALQPKINPDLGPKKDITKKLTKRLDVISCPDKTAVI
jgi:hypothetical protein